MLQNLNNENTKYHGHDTIYYKEKKKSFYVFSPSHHSLG